MILPSKALKMCWNSLFGYLTTILLISGITAINIGIQPYVGIESLLLAYFLAVLLISLRLSRGPVFLSAGLAALAWNHFFVKPVYTFEIHAPGDFIAFILFFLVASLAAFNTNRLRSQVNLTKIREERLAFLLKVTAKLGELSETDRIVAYAKTEIRNRFGSEAIFIIPKEPLAHLRPLIDNEHQLLPEEKNAAFYSLNECTASGFGTDHFSGLKCFFLPLLGRGGPFGIVALRLNTHSHLTQDERMLFIAFIEHIALMIDRDRLLTISQRLKTNEEIDRLYTTILNLITHELRTPLSIVKGVFTAVQSETILSNTSARTRLNNEGESALLRLDRLIDNLLDMSKIESGKLKLNLDWCDPIDIVNSAVNEINKEFPDAKHQILQDYNVLVRMDYALLERAFYNLIKNSIMYGCPDNNGEVVIKIFQNQDALVLAIADQGAGLPPELEQNPFLKFAKRTNLTSGIGIGLSIVKGIVELHNGTISYCNDNGAVFSISIPLTGDNSREFVA